MDDFSIDVVSYAVSQASTNLMSDISIAVLDKAMDMQKMMGEQLTKLMESSVNPAVGGNVDVRI